MSDGEEAARPFAPIAWGGMAAYLLLTFVLSWVPALILRQVWHGTSAPSWARNGHRIGATTLAGVFTVNTVTGLWNLWDSRSVSEGRALRYVHAISMLAADAGFTYAGAKLSEEAETSTAKRRQHRQLALTSMGITAASGLMMKFFNK